MISLVKNVAPEQDVKSIVFKSAMRLLMGGVSVITAGQGEDISGMTVTSLSSFATDPATVVISVNRLSSSWLLIQRYGSFGVSILANDQIEAAERFSGKGGFKGRDRFRGEDCITLVSGVPLLNEALAVLDCEVDNVVERHSHALLIGAVRDLRISPDKSDGLAYANGRYIPIQDNEDALRLAAVSGPTTSRTLWKV